MHLSEPRWTVFLRNAGENRFTWVLRSIQVPIIIKMIDKGGVK